MHLQPQIRTDGLWPTIDPQSERSGHIPLQLANHPTFDFPLNDDELSPSPLPTSADLNHIYANLRPNDVPFLLSPQFDLDHLSGRSEAEDSEIDAQYIVYPRPVEHEEDQTTALTPVRILNLFEQPELY